jgi:ABC-type tungstate transport system substrate-binding protein
VVLTKALFTLMHTIHAAYVKQSITNLYVVAYIYAPTLETVEPRVHVLAMGLGENPAINSMSLQRLLKR